MFRVPQERNLVYIYILSEKVSTCKERQLDFMYLRKPLRVMVFNYSIMHHLSFGRFPWVDTYVEKNINKLYGVIISIHTIIKYIEVSVSQYVIADSIV